MLRMSTLRPAPGRQRRPRRRVLLMAGLGLILLLLFVATPVVANRLLERRMTSIAACLVPDGATIEQVDVNSSALWALATGRLGSATVRATDVAVGPSTIDGTLNLSGLAIRGGDEKRVEAITGTIATGIDLLALASLPEEGLPAGVTSALKTDGDVLAIELTGLSDPIRIELEPSLSGVSMQLSPVSVYRGSRRFEPNRVPRPGEIPASLLRARVVPMPPLPETVHLTSVDVAADHLVFALAIDVSAGSGRLGELIHECRARR